MCCTVGMEFRIPTGPTFWLTNLDCLDGVGGGPIQSIKSIAWSLNCQCLVLGTVSEVKTWRKDLWTFAGGNTSCTVCCFKSKHFTFVLPLLSFLIEASSESVRSCHRALRRTAVLDSLPFARGHKPSFFVGNRESDFYTKLKIRLCANHVTQVCEAHDQVILSFLQQVRGLARPNTEEFMENIGHNVHV